jgi:hypothetical protein
MRGVAQVVKCLICQHPEFKSQSHQKKENTPTHIHMYIYIYIHTYLYGRVGHGSSQDIYLGGAVLGFELRALHLLGRYSTTWAKLPAQVRTFLGRAILDH